MAIGSVDESVGLVDSTEPIGLGRVDETVGLGNVDEHVLGVVLNWVDGASRRALLFQDRALSEAAREDAGWLLLEAQSDATALRRRARRLVSTPKGTGDLGVVRCVVHGSPGAGATALVDRFVSGRYIDHRRKHAELRKLVTHVRLDEEQAPAKERNLSSGWYCEEWRYSAEAELRLEAATGRVDLRVEGRDYVVDLCTMEQTNLETGFIRKVEHRVPDGKEQELLPSTYRVEVFDKTETARGTPFASALYRGRVVLVFVLDLRSRCSFDSLEAIVKRARASCDAKTPPFRPDNRRTTESVLEKSRVESILVGTKADDVDGDWRVVTEAEARGLAADLQMHYIETSSARDRDVSTAFLFPLARLLI